jgi:proton-coupled amino acid transporter
MSQVVDEYHDPALDVRLYMLLLLPPLILINWVRSLKLLAPFSSFANVVTFVGLGVTLYYVFDGIPSPEERRWTGNVVDLPLFIGTTLFALEAVGVVSQASRNGTASLAPVRAPTAGVRLPAAPRPPLEPMGIQRPGREAQYSPV